MLTANDIAGLDEIAGNAVYRSFPDAHQPGNLGKTYLRVLGDAQQNVGMVGEEGPLRNLGSALERPQCHDCMVVGER